MLTDLKILLQAGATMNLQQSAANFHWKCHNTSNA